MCRLDVLVFIDNAGYVQLFVDLPYGMEFRYG